MKRAVALVDGGMSKVARSKSHFPVFKFQSDRLFPRTHAHHVGIAQRHKQIVIVVLVDKRSCPGRNCHIEHAHVFILKNEMMAGFRCDLHGLLVLGQSGCGQKQQARDAGLSHIKIVKITPRARKCDLCFWRFAPHRFETLKNPTLTTDNTDNTDLHGSKKFN